MKNSPLLRPASRCILASSIASIAILASALPSNAASATWNGTNNVNWNDATNWSAGIPGVGDTATFSGSGSGHIALDLGSGVTIQKIVFDSASAAAYTLGAGGVGSQSLTLGNGGSITVNSSVTTNQAINSRLVLGTDGSAQSFSLVNNSSSPGQLLTVLGSITGSNGTGKKSLTIAGLGNTILSGVIDNGSGGGVLSLTKSGGGTLTLNGTAANGYTGATTVSSGTLALDFANATTPSNLINSQSALVLNGGALQVLQKSDTATSQTFAGTTLASGNSTITATNVGTLETVNLALGNISRTAGATVNFTGAPARGSIATTSTNTNSILGTWATIGSGTSMTYAKVDGSGNIVAATSANGTGDLLTSITEAGWDGTGTKNYQLTGAITLTGNRSINALRLAGPGQVVTLGNFNLTMNGLMSVGSGTSLTFNRGATGSAGNIVIGANKELVVTGSSNVVFNTPIVDNGDTPGASGLTYSGSGIMVLAGANTYTGTTTINSGTLRLGNGGSTGSIAGGDVVNHGTLEISRSDAVTLANAVSGTGTINKIGTNVVTLSGNSSYDGLTKVNAGTLTVAHNNALGSAAGGTIVSNGASLLLQNGVTVTGETVTIAGNGATSLGALAADSNAVATWAGTVDLGGGSSRVGARDGAVLTISGPIVNGTALLISSSDVTPTGTVIISGTNNTYTGPTNIVRGTLKIGANNALPVGTTLDVHNAGTTNPATFDLNGFSQTVAALQRSDSTGASTVTNSSGTLGTLTVNGSADTTFGGNITGGDSLALTKAGTGTLTLTGTNTYSGVTTISGGGLKIGAGGTTGSMGSGNIVNNATLELSRSNAATFANNISGTGAVKVSGTGVTTLSGTNTYTGTTSVASGQLDLVGTFTSNVSVADGASLGGEGATAGSITFNGINSLYFNPSSSAFLNASSVSANGATVTLRLTAGSAAATGIVVINAPGGITGTAGTGGNFQFVGRGSTYLNGTNTQLLFDYTPATLTWKGSDATSPTLWDDATTNWSNGGTPDKFITGDSIVFNDTASSYFVEVQGTSVEAGNITFNNSSHAYTLTGAGITGAGSLTKSGTNTVTISNANTYTGGTTISAGTIQLGDGTNATGSLGTGAVTNNASLVTDFGTNTVTVANAISGTGTLTQNGFGTVTLTGNNTYSGGTTIGAGKLQISGTGTLGTGSVLNDGELIFNRSGTYSVTNAIGGVGDVRSQNNGLLTLGTSNTYSGITYITSGAVIVTANSGVLGNTTGGTVISGNSTLGLSGGVSYAAGEALLLSGTGVQTTEFFFPGSLNQRGALQSVSGDNTWAGPITITATNTRIGVQDGAGLTISGTISDEGAGHTLIFRGGTNTAGMITLSGTGNSWGRTDVYGSSTRIAGNDVLPTGSSLYVGTNNVGNSIFDLNGYNQTVTGISNVAGTAAVNIITNNGSSDSVLTLNGSQDLSYLGTLSDGPTNKLSLVKSGSFKQTLTGPATYTGSTKITEGTLAVGVGGSISGSTSINISGGAKFDVSALTGGFTLGSTQTMTGGEGSTAGTITGTLTADTGATVAPGLGAGNTGTLSISNGFTLASTAHLSLDIRGTTAGTGYDQLIVDSGNVSLSGDLSGSTLAFGPTDFADVFFIIVNNGTGSTTGSLNGVAEGGSIFISGREFQISYTSDLATGFAVNGGGNDVALMAVPEPGTMVSLLSGLGVLLGFRRRRRA